MHTFVLCDILQNSCDKAMASYKRTLQGSWVKLAAETFGGKNVHEF